MVDGRDAGTICGGFCVGVAFPFYIQTQGNFFQNSFSIKLSSGNSRIFQAISRAEIKYSTKDVGFMANNL